MAEADDGSDNPLWRFSLAVYAAPGVEGECLALQAAHGIDVNLLLFCAWAGAQKGWRLSAADLQGAHAAVRAWQATVVEPLRSARRAIKAMSALRDDPAAQELRRRIAAGELEAERIEQGLLLAQSSGVDARPRTGDAPPAEIVRANIALLLEPHGAALPQALMAAALHAASPGRA